MKTAAIIQARMGSSRLPNKVLMPVLGKPLLGWMLERILLCNEIDEILIATTKEYRDDPIVEFSNKNGYKVFRGNEEDVLDRYYKAALTVLPNIIVRLTADCPLIDPKILSILINEFKNSELDFLSNSEPLPSSWPDGMDVSIFSFEALKKAWKNAEKPSEREHVTFYFWNNPHFFRCKRMERIPNFGKYRLTVDYLEDFYLIEKIIQHFSSVSVSNVSSVSMENIINFLDINPNIYSLNEKYIRGIGWNSSFDKDKKYGY